MSIPSGSLGSQTQQLTTIKIPTRLWDQIGVVAEKERRSKTKQLEVILDDHFSKPGEDDGVSP